MVNITQHCYLSQFYYESHDYLAFLLEPSLLESWYDVRISAFIPSWFVGLWLRIVLDAWDWQYRRREFSIMETILCTNKNGLSTALTIFFRGMSGFRARPWYIDLLSVGSISYRFWTDPSTTSTEPHWLQWSGRWAQGATPTEQLGGSGPRFPISIWPWLVKTKKSYRKWARTIWNKWADPSPVSSGKTTTTVSSRRRDGL